MGVHLRVFCLIPPPPARTRALIDQRRARSRFRRKSCGQRQSFCTAFSVRRRPQHCKMKAALQNGPRARTAEAGPKERERSGAFLRSLAVICLAKHQHAEKSLSLSLVSRSEHSRSSMTSNTLRPRVFPPFFPSTFLAEPRVLGPSPKSHFFARF